MFNVDGVSCISAIPIRLYDALSPINKWAHEEIELLYLELGVWVSDLSPYSPF